MKNTRNIIISLIILFIFIGILLIIFGITNNNNDDNPQLTQKQASKILEKEYKDKIKDMNIIYETDNYYKYSIESDDESVSGNYYVKKDDKTITKESSASDTSSISSTK